MKLCINSGFSIRIPNSDNSRLEEFRIKEVKEEVKEVINSQTLKSIIIEQEDSTKTNRRFINVELTYEEKVEKDSLLQRMSKLFNLIIGFISKNSDPTAYKMALEEFKCDEKITKFYRTDIDTYNVPFFKTNFEPIGSTSLDYIKVTDNDHLAIAGIVCRDKTVLKPEDIRKYV